MMSVSGLTCNNPSRCYQWLPPPRGNALLPCRQVSVFMNYCKNPKERIGLLRFDRSYLACSLRRCRQQLEKSTVIKCAMDASFGDTTEGQNAIFPRINVRDPYKRLGINKAAFEEEIHSARRFLVQKHAGHKPSVDSIEAAHNKIIMQKFYDRKNPKIDIKKKVREVRQSKVIQVVTSRFQAPSTKFIIKTAVAFLVLGALTVLYPTEDGPTLQVAISLMAAIYFIYDRLRSKFRAFLYGAGAFTFSWLFGTFLMVSLVPPMIDGVRGFEVTTSLISYVLLWISSTYLT